jgi:molybdenum cofactor cytidylyltransferase
LKSIDRPAIAAIILAAGASTRMGQPKQLLPDRGDRGQNLLKSTVMVAIEANCSPIIAVLGAGIDRILPELKALPVRSIENKQWQTGMASSIRAGLQAIVNERNLEAAIFLLCDLPFVRAETIDRLIHTYITTKKPIVASAYNNTLGSPALFDRSCFAELLNLEGTEGAKKIIQRHLDNHSDSKVATIDFPEGAIDLDTPQDYQRYLANS